MDNQLSLSLPNTDSSFKELHARVPKDWLVKPIFIPGIQPNNREIIVNNNKWIMGINNPLSKEPIPSSNITLGHIKVVFAVLTFFQGKNPVAMSATELARRCSNDRGGRYYRDLLQKLNDLRNYWVSITNQSGVTKEFSLLGKITIIKKIPKKKPIKNTKEKQVPMWLDSIELHEDFVNFMKDFAQTMHLRFDTMRKLTSDIAQSIYLFLPSRAFHRTEENPFEITLTNLFEQLGMEKRTKSVRYKLLTQNKTSVIKQLDCSGILTGRLRVKLEETRDKLDWKLVSWVEKETKSIDLSKSESSLVESWCKSGRSKEELTKKLFSLAELDEYEIELLEKSGIEYDSCKKFLRQSKTLLGETRFQRLLSESKSEKLEKRHADNPTGAFIWRLLDQIAQS